MCVGYDIMTFDLVLPSGWVVLLVCLTYDRIPSDILVSYLYT